mmetsp:Transcript_35729/g.70785  ORF Transcript_35729/g.70785 Transcript_35729/m.70785 type:complete len:400 (-) Transcript_35729:167-1366(-)
MSFLGFSLKASRAQPRGSHTVGGVAGPQFRKDNSEKDELQKVAKATSHELQGRPRVFLDISIEDQRIGRIVCELFNDIVPLTADNFRLLCTGEAGFGIHGKPLHYKGSPFHRVVPGFMVQGGDFTSAKQDGSGGESVYGLKFDDEGFDIKHNFAGILTMANKGPNSNGSQFMITTKPSPSLDRKNVAFGHVVRGMEVVHRIVETCGVAHNGELLCPTPGGHEVVAFGASRPTAYICDCGELPAGDGMLALAAGIDSDRNASVAATGAPTSKRRRLAAAVENQDDGEVLHLYHLLKKHSGLRWPQTWKGTPATCTRNKAKLAVEGIRKRLVASPKVDKTFVELAREHSDAATSQQGGDLGEVKRGELDDEIEGVAFSLPPGGLSEVFETEEGVHLVLRAF